MSTDTVIPIEAQDPYSRFTSGDPSKGRGNQESRAAWQRVLDHLVESQLDVLCIVQGCHPEPVNAKEIAQALNKPLHCISGRVTELLEMGLVEKTDTVRNRSRCLRLATGLPRMRLV
jgi:hypothetical protein